MPFLNQWAIIPTNGGLPVWYYSSKQAALDALPYWEAQYPNSKFVVR